MAADGNRHRDEVVADRQSEVLAHQRAGVAGDLQRIRNRRQAFVHEDETCRGAADVGSTCRRHRDVGSGKGGRVVQAVADHQDRATLAPQRLDAGDLLGRQEGGSEALDAEAGGESGNRRRAVARQDLDRQSLALQAGHCRGGPRTDGALQPEAGKFDAVAGKQHH